jgi:hypothetical protein
MRRRWSASRGMLTQLTSSCLVSKLRLRMGLKRRWRECFNQRVNVDKKSCFWLSTWLPATTTDSTLQQTSQPTTDATYQVTSSQSTQGTSRGTKMCSRATRESTCSVTGYMASSRLALSGRPTVAQSSCTLTTPSRLTRRSQLLRTRMTETTLHLTIVTMRFGASL